MFIIDMDYWNASHDQLLILIQSFLSDLIDIYKNEYINYKNKLCKYKIPTIIFTSTSGFLSITLISYFTEEYHKLISLCIGSINLLTTIITLLENFKHISDNMILDDNLYHQSLELYNDIEVILKLNIEDRKDNGKNTIDNIYNRFKEIIKKSNLYDDKFTMYLKIKQLKKTLNN